MTPFSDDVGREILAAFGPRFDWRTVGGISRSTRIPADVVERYIADHPDWFVRSRISPGGFALYSVSESARERLATATADFA